MSSNNTYRSQVSGLELTRKYSYMSDEQWRVVDTLRLPLGLTVSQFISHLVIAAAMAKESNDSQIKIS